MATDATGTPTTNYSFPTYNTAVDRPSGLGLNAIVQDIDSKLASSATLLGAVARSIIAKAGTVVGTRRKLNFIEGTNVTLTVADDAANEKVDITIAAAGAIDVVSLASFPPASPTDGQTIWLELPSTYDQKTSQVIRWLCTYNAAGAYWDVSGPPIVAYAATSNQIANNTTYVDITNGPSITVPRPGKYYLYLSFTYSFSTNVNGVAYMSAALGATAASDDWAASTFEYIANSGTAVGAAGRQSGPFDLASGASVVTKTRVSVSMTPPTFTARNIYLTPLTIT